MAEAVNRSNVAHKRLDVVGGPLAYRQVEGRGPGVLFLGGFMSDMTGSKASRLAEWAESGGRAFTRFDYRGHGASGGRFVDGTIGDWLDDATAILDRATEGPMILVGSSMGGWIAPLLALRRPERVVGLIGIASAPDFTEDLMWNAMGEATREKLTAEGMIEVRSLDASIPPEIITRALIEDGRKHLLLRDEIPIRVPVRLFHGVRDREVPWSTSVRLMERLAGTDVRLTLFKDGDHRLSRSEETDPVLRALEEIAGLSTGVLPS